MTKAQLEHFEKGDLILVRWLDASDLRGTLAEHQNRPEIRVKDWGIFLGVSGRKRRFLIIGKDVVEEQNDWGATRIPLELVEEVVLLMTRQQLVQTVGEVKTLGRKIRLRRYKQERFNAALA